MISLRIPLRYGMEMLLILKLCIQKSKRLHEVLPVVFFILLA